MVNVIEFKQNIEKLLSQNYRVEFLGKNFDQIVELMSESMAQSIYQWLLNVVRKSIQPITVASKKPYKEWVINQLLVFRYAFNLKSIEYRILLVKVKNSIYIEFHLGDHNYYDKVRKNLDLKRTSY